MDRFRGLGQIADVQSVDLNSGTAKVIFKEGGKEYFIRTKDVRLVEYLNGAGDAAQAAEFLKEQAGAIKTITTSATIKEVRTDKSNQSMTFTVEKEGRRSEKTVHFSEVSTQSLRGYADGSKLQEHLDQCKSITDSINKINKLPVHKRVFQILAKRTLRKEYQKAFNQWDEAELLTTVIKGSILVSDTMQDKDIADLIKIDLKDPSTTSTKRFNELVFKLFTRWKEQGYPITRESFQKYLDLDKELPDYTSTLYLRKHNYLSRLIEIFNNQVGTKAIEYTSFLTDLKRLGLIEDTTYNALLNRIKEAPNLTSESSTYIDQLRALPPDKTIIGAIILDPKIDASQEIHRQNRFILDDDRHVLISTSPTTPILNDYDTYAAFIKGIFKNHNMHSDFLKLHNQIIFATAIKDIIFNGRESNIKGGILKDQYLIKKGNHLIFGYNILVPNYESIADGKIKDFYLEKGEIILDLDQIDPANSDQKLTDIITYTQREVQVLARTVGDPEQLENLLKSQEPFVPLRELYTLNMICAPPWLASSKAQVLNFFCRMIPEMFTNTDPQGKILELRDLLSSWNGSKNDDFETLKNFIYDWLTVADQRSDTDPKVSLEAYLAAHP